MTATAVLAPTVQDLLSGVQTGNRRAIARLITLSENEEPEAAAIMATLQPRLGHAHVIGVTGAPGTGKSTLADRLIQVARRAGLKVGVVCIDPSSPFTGGAILGDRIRMTRHAGDPDVFIRSMGSRGALGGLSHHTLEAVKVLDAAGKDVILVETVGVGQAEVDIARLADTVLVVLVPNLGDDVQAVKAGLMEVADLFVVNKADLTGADKVAGEVEASLMLAHGPAAPDGGEPWSPPILRTSAEKGDGIVAVWDTIQAHKAWSQKSGAWALRRAKRARAQLESLLGRAILSHAFPKGRTSPYAPLVADVEAGRVAPADAAKRIVDGFRGKA
jgi:LAO/AO transport system kinase